MSKRLLILEDDFTMRQTLTSVFRKRDFAVYQAENGADALAILEVESIDVMLIDMKLPDMSGLEFWKKAASMEEDFLAIFMTAYPEVKTAVTAMREGAFDYINKPFELDELRIIVDKAFSHLNLKFEVQRLRYEKDHESRAMGDILGKSDAIESVREQISQVASVASTPVLILGESGVGKELVANAIHHLSARSHNPFLKLNCSSIPESLLEQALFGNEKVSFKETNYPKKGIFEMANSGGIFLDEIGDLNYELQPKLLRVLEAKSLRRAGGTRDMPVDVRLISATNQNIHQLAEEGRFRTDLLYRLNVFTINMPPLRDRTKDIPALAAHFIKGLNRALKTNIEGIEESAITQMKKYAWPGNIRELRNVIERACIIAQSKVITEKEISLNQSVTAQGFEQERRALFSVYNNWVPLESVERMYIEEALSNCDGNKSEAARRLGISRVTLREKLRKPVREQNQVDPES